MRKLDILASFLAVALSVGATYRSWPHLFEGDTLRPERDRPRISEVGALFRFEPRASTEPTRAPEPALALTASDGTGLTLAALDARGVIQGPLAFTELRLVFENPLDRTLEGTFRVTLPQGAAISRFAMRQGDRWQEGEVVEKQAARQAYEDFLHRKQDPALLEQAAGNEFSARVFPIPARGRKELVLSYSQQLGPDSPYMVPLRGLPRVGKLDAVVSRAGDDAPIVGQVHLTDAAPERDLVVEASKLPASDGVRSGELALVRVKPAAEAGADVIGSALVLVDTSASRALGFAQQIALVERLAAGLGAGVPLVVAAFDQGVDVVYEGPAGGFAAAGPARLQQRQAFGASDLEGALEWARTRAKNASSRRVILVSDGVPTVGATEPAALRGAARALGASGVERLDVLAVGGIRDDAQLRGLTSSGLARNGVVIDAARDAESMVRRLNAATRTVQVKVEGAKWQWPTVLDGVQPGDEALIFATLPPESAVQVSLDGKAIPTPKLAAVERPLLERAWAQARIEQLSQRPAEGQPEEQVKREIIELSTKHRVLSPHTALLVLESEQDYARFKIDRNALVNILAIENTQLVLQKRSAVVAPEVEKSDVPVTQKKQTDGVVLKAPAPPPPAPGAPLVDQNRELARALATATAAAVAAADAPRAAAPAPMEAAASRTERKPSAALASEENDKREMKAKRDESPRPSSPAKMRAPAAMDGDVADMSADGVFHGPAYGNTPAGGKRGPAGPAPGQASIGARRNTNEEPRDVVPAPAPVASASVARPTPPPTPAPAPAPSVGPYTGEMAAVMGALERGDKAGALALAVAFREKQPGDVLALLALGEVFEAMGEARSAARAYGSIIDLFSSRADLRRMAGERLERLGLPYTLALAADSYEKAAQQRPDHPSSHRLLAYARLRSGDPAGAFAAIEAGAARSYPAGRFRGVDRILREDMGLIAAAWLRVEPGRRDEVTRRMAAAKGVLAEGPSLRFVLNWETDANDVDFHIHDSKGGHAYFSARKLPSGGELYDDVTTGYGPECFTVPLPVGQRAAPYKLQAHYYSRGPMGYGMGKLEIIDHDGQGNLTFEERPFVVMQDRAYVDLGTFPASGPAPRAPGKE